MKLWIFLVSALFIQERISTDTALFQARIHNYNIWIIHSIWFFATCSTILGGYYFGKWIQTAFKDSAFDTRIKGVSKKIERVLGKQGEIFAFILLGIVNFPYINGILASVVNVPLRVLFPLMFLGDALWYTSAWIMNIYIRRHVHNPHFAIYIVIGIGIILGIVFKKLFNRLTK